MTQHRELTGGSPVPESWFDTFQEFIGTVSANFSLSLANPTTIQVVAGTTSDQVGIGIDGKWRYRSVTVQQAHPGGGAGEFDIWVVASANSFSGSGLGEVDNTDYTFGLAIVTSGGAEPTGTYNGNAIAHARKVGTLTWSGTAITDVRQTVGQSSLVKHASQHVPGGSDALDFALVAAAVHLRGTLAARPAASAANNGMLYYTTDTQIIYRSITSSWEVWGGLGVGKVVATIGNGSLTVIDVAHGLATRDVVVGVREAASPWAVVYPEVQALDANTVRLIFSVAPASNAYVVTVIGGNVGAAEAATAATLENAWVSADGEGADYFKNDGVVFLNGSVQDGATATTIFTLPVGYRPAKPYNLPAVKVDSGAVVGVATVRVATDGTVTPTFAGDAATRLSFNGHFHL